MHCLFLCGAFFDLDRKDHIAPQRFGHLMQSCPAAAITVAYERLGVILPTLFSG